MIEWVRRKLKNSKTQKFIDSMPTPEIKNNMPYVVQIENGKLKKSNCTFVRAVTEVKKDGVPAGGDTPRLNP